MFKRAQNNQVGDFQRRRRTFSWLWERFKLFWTSQMSEYLIVQEAMKTSKDLSGKLFWTFQTFKNASCLKAYN